MRPKGICSCPFFLSSFPQNHLPSPTMYHLNLQFQVVCPGQTVYMCSGLMCVLLVHATNLKKVYALAHSFSLLLLRTISLLRPISSGLVMNSMNTKCCVCYGQSVCLCSRLTCEHGFICAHHPSGDQTFL